MTRPRFIPVNQSQDKRTKNFGAETARLACVPGQTGQTPRCIKTEPMRRRTQRAFPKSRDSTAVSSAPISETPVQCEGQSNQDAANQILLEPPRDSSECLD